MEEPRKLTWNTIEHEYTEKTQNWYWIIGIVAISIALIAIIFNNVLFAVLVIVGVFTLTLLATKKPQELSIELNQRGVRVNEILYPYTTIDSFWVEEEIDTPRILIKSNKTFAPLLVILIEPDQVSGDIVHDFLLNHLDEEEHQEPLFQKVLERVGF